MFVIIGLLWKNKLFLVCIIKTDLQNALKRLSHIRVPFYQPSLGKKNICHSVVYGSQCLRLKFDASFAAAFPCNG